MCFNHIDYHIPSQTHTTYHKEVPFFVLNCQTHTYTSYHMDIRMFVYIMSEAGAKETETEA